MAGGCHQCRRRTKDLALHCKRVMMKDNSCSILFCHKCLLTRYGEKAEEVAALEDWACPKCRGVCSCNICVKKRSQQPLGMDANESPREASVSKNRKLADESDIVEPEDIKLPKACDGIKDETFAKEEEKFEGIMSNGIGKGNVEKDSHQEAILLHVAMEKDWVDKNGSSDMIEDKCSTQSNGNQSPERSKDRNVLLPRGTPLTMVAGVKLPPDDVGPALQFLEFCNAFSEVLGIKKGQPEIVLRELTRTNSKSLKVHPSVVGLHIKLLSLIQKDLGEGSLLKSKISASSWLKALTKCINEQCHFKGLSSECFDKEALKYDTLDASQKLIILNLLCDQTLETADLRSWIDEENIKFHEKEKESEAKAPIPKMKDLNQKMNAKVAKVMLCLKERSLVSISEHDNVISETESKTKRLHSEVTENILNKKKQRIDAVRTEPILLEGNGEVYWRLGGCGNSRIMLQEIRSWDLLTNRDMWFVYDNDSEQIIQKYITSLLRMKLFEEFPRD
ncbi:Zinc-finger domain of monoamine-oxidase A repressor R1 domain-containing protein [Dioscorea alata]|uniref:Zinc-finger domain of monoamine-oxidase A repressor R1 domain-containing protein n=1 Tax=Dioscorea alata TaxID=55571 RepID=A0ACB7UDP5_DIOAL|nr:Zinc-finger domain of monoamine-oxidase A repressor R1 domain-containing protein [Dioscorea alata]